MIGIIVEAKLRVMYEL